MLMYHMIFLSCKGEFAVFNAFPLPCKNSAQIDDLLMTLLSFSKYIKVALYVNFQYCFCNTLSTINSEIVSASNIPGT